MHVKIPISNNLFFISPLSSCPFCCKRETIKHIFWLCSHAQKLWRFLFLTFSALFPQNWSWKDALLGFSPAPNITIQSFRHIILKQIWPLRCIVIFSLVIFAHIFCSSEVEYLMVTSDFSPLLLTLKSALQ